MAFKAFLVSLFFYFSYGYSGFFGFIVDKYMLRQPLIGGFICGLIYGDLQTGLSLGITLQLAYMGVFAVGGAMTMDVGAVAYPTIGLALASGVDAGTAVALAATISTLSPHVQNIHRFADNFFNQMFIRAVEKGDRRGWTLAYNVWPQIVGFAVKVIPAFLLIYYGPTAVDALMEVLPEKLLYAFGKFSKIMPAIGMAMLLKYIVVDKWSFLFFLFGFSLFAYSDIPFLYVAIIAMVIAYMYYQLRITRQKAEEIQSGMAPEKNHEEEEAL